MQYNLNNDEESVNCNHFGNGIWVSLRKASSLLKQWCLWNVKQHLMRLKDYLRNFNSWHRKSMKTEDLWAVVTHNKALKFLLMDREVTSFDIEVTPSRKAKHILTLCIPSHAICIWFLKSKGTDDYNRCSHIFPKKQASFSQNIWPTIAWMCTHTQLLFTCVIF